MTLLICPVRPGDDNDELRFAMRSWQANLHLGSELELWTVGYQPRWLTPDRHVEGNRHASMPLAVFDNVLLGAKAAAEAGYEEVVYMNDDFFCMDAVGAILPVRRHRSLAQQLAKFPGAPGLWWPKSLRLTLDYLTEQGFPDPPSFEVHRPLLADPAGMVEALERWAKEGWPKGDGTVPQWRTLYGVLNEVEAHPVIDAKLSTQATGFGTPWVSTSDQTWRRYRGGMRKRFPETSRWETQPPISRPAGRRPDGSP